MTTENKEIIIWEDKSQLVEIRKLYAPKLTDLEYHAFVQLGKATNLNPFLREIWAVKYESGKAAQIFIGRDGYRKGAQANPDYDYHQCDAVYSKDEFKIRNGEVEHTYSFGDRGQIVGAYCTVKRKNSSKPMYVFVEFREYTTGRSLWGSKPATMIKKVAEAQALRMAFQELFAGSYCEEEMEKSTRTDELKERLGTHNDNFAKAKDITPAKEDEQREGLSEVAAIESTQGNVVDQVETQGVVTNEQVEQINDLLQIKKFNHERFKKALKYFKVNKIGDLKYNDAEHMIELLCKA